MRHTAKTYGCLRSIVSLECSSVSSPGSASSPCVASTPLSAWSLSSVVHGHAQVQASGWLRMCQSRWMYRVKSILTDILVDVWPAIDLRWSNDVCLLRAMRRCQCYQMKCISCEDLRNPLALRMCVWSKNLLTAFHASNFMYLAIDLEQVSTVEWSYMREDLPSGFIWRVEEHPSSYASKWTTLSAFSRGINYRHERLTDSAKDSVSQVLSSAQIEVWVRNLSPEFEAVESVSVKVNLQGSSKESVNATGYGHSQLIIEVLTCVFIIPHRLWPASRRLPQPPAWRPGPCCTKDSSLKAKTQVESDQ